MWAPADVPPVNVIPPELETFWSSAEERCKPAPPAGVTPNDTLYVSSLPFRLMVPGPDNHELAHSLCSESIINQQAVQARDVGQSPVDNAVDVVLRTTSLAFT